MTLFLVCDEMDVGANAEVEPTKRKVTMELLKRTIVSGVSVMVIQSGWLPTACENYEGFKHPMCEIGGVIAVPPPAFVRLSELEGRTKMSRHRMLILIMLDRST